MFSAAELFIRHAEFDELSWSNQYYVSEPIHTIVHEFINNNWARVQTAKSASRAQRNFLLEDLIFDSNQKQSFNAVMNQAIYDLPSSKPRDPDPTPTPESEEDDEIPWAYLGVALISFYFWGYVGYKKMYN